MTTMTDTPVLLTEAVLQLSSGKTWSIKGPLDDETITNFIAAMTARLAERSAGRIPGSVEIVAPNGTRTIVAVAHVEGMIVYPLIDESEQPGD